jgi:predicted Kef-type K+ transport protein
MESREARLLKSKGAGISPMVRLVDARDMWFILHIQPARIMLMTDFQWIAIALGDVVWIFIAFVLGLLSRSAGLPPLVGFLAAGFLLNAYGFAGGDVLQKLSDLGITLLLFTVGLKLNLRTLARPQVWAVTGIHSSVVIVVFGVAIYALALAGAHLFSGLDFSRALLIAFALSFSSTVFVVKALEGKGQMASLHGRIAVGILIMQDLAAVAFLAISIGKWPSAWALLVVLLIPLRPVLTRLLERIGHGELLVLYAFILAMGGAEIFELVGLKGDLGALVLGALMANHPKADELAKTMLGFKDLFLLGFFVSIGLSGQLTTGTILIGLMIVPFVFFKSALFFLLLTAFRLRARTSLFASINLTNFSEFGLIVMAISVANGWLDSEWLLVVTVAMSLSFVIAAILSKFSQQLYTSFRASWKRWQKDRLIADDRLLDTGGAKVAVIGMGRVGSSAYDIMRDLHGEKVIGVDIDPWTVRDRQSSGRNVLLGDASDADFWDRVQAAHALELVMIALPNSRASLAVLEQLKAASFAGRIAATAKFPDEEAALTEGGATMVFNIYTEAGVGFASHVIAKSEGS